MSHESSWEEVEQAIALIEKYDIFGNKSLNTRDTNMRNADSPAAVVESEWDGTQYTGITKLETVAMAALPSLIADGWGASEAAEHAFAYAEAFFKRANEVSK